MNEVEKIEMTLEEIEDLAATYGADDPDIQAALEIARAEEAPPAETGEEVPPTETGVEDPELDLAAPPAEGKGEGEEGAPPATQKTGEKENLQVPIDALHAVRKKNQELEAKIAELQAKQAPAPPQKEDADPEERFLQESPGKIARSLFIQEKGEEPDVYNPEHLVRLQELTSLVTIRQMEAGQMQQRVQAEREAFRVEVLALAQEVQSHPEVTEALDAKFLSMPESASKKILAAAIQQLTEGKASREEFEVVKEFFEETRREIQTPPAAPKEAKPNPKIDVAMNLPKTADLGGAGGTKADVSLGLIEQKLDKGIKLTPEEEKIVASLK